MKRREAAPPPDTRAFLRAPDASEAVRAGADAAGRILASPRGIRWPADLRAQALRDAVHALSDDDRRLLVCRLLIEEGDRLKVEAGASLNAPRAMPLSADGRVTKGA